MEKPGKAGYGKSGETERRYVQLAPESVSVAGESIGLSNVPAPVCRALAEDASYRVREVASLAALLLRHGRKRKLGVADMNRALKWCGVSPVLGQGCGTEVAASQCFQHLPDGDIFVDRDVEVQLVEEALGTSSTSLNEEQKLEVNASWLAVEGAVTPGTEGSGLSPALIQYYTSLVSCLLGDSELLCSTILKDVRTNPKLAPLIPYLVTFIRQGLKRYPNKPQLNTRILRLLSSLFYNPYLNLSPKPHLSHLVTALLTTILGGAATMELVPLCASILSLALDRWATTVNQLQVQTLRHLRDFLTPERSTAAAVHAQHGALTTLTMLGPVVLFETPWPAHLISSLEKRDQHLPLWGALRRAGAARIKHMLDDSDHNTPDFAFYGYLYEAFGDSLLPELKKLHDGLTVQKPSERPGPLRLKRVRGLRRRRDERELRASQDVFTATQNFDFLADMPSDIFESEMDVDKREAGELGVQRQVSFSGSSREAFECQPLRVRSMVKIHLPMASQWGRERLRAPKTIQQGTGTRGVPWRHMALGGRVGTAARRADGKNLAKITHYWDLLTVVI